MSTTQGAASSNCHQLPSLITGQRLRRAQNQVQIAGLMQRCKAAGQLEPGAAADTPDPTAGIEYRAQLSQGCKRRQVTVDNDVTQLLPGSPDG